MIYFKTNSDGLVINIAFVKPKDAESWQAVDSLPTRNYGDKIYFDGGAFRVVRHGHDEAEQSRAAAYRERVDPITCEIQRLRDMGGSAEEITEAEARREAAVAAIKAQWPYPEEAN